MYSVETRLRIDLTADPRVAHSTDPVILVRLEPRLIRAEKERKNHLMGILLHHIFLRNVEEGSTLARKSCRRVSTAAGANAAPHRLHPRPRSRGPALASPGEPGSPGTHPPAQPCCCAFLARIHQLRAEQSHGKSFAGRCCCRRTV